LLSIPKIGEVKAVLHRSIEGKAKTVTISKTPTDKYFASILCEVKSDVETPWQGVCTIGGKTIGIDLGLKDFAIVMMAVRYKSILIQSLEAT
jgi:putative transposase